MAIQRIRIPKYTDEWYAARMNGYGASEIAQVCSEYSDELAADLPGGSPIDVHLHKLGEPGPYFKGNVRSKAGQMMENMIIYLYRFWDHSDPRAEKMYENEMEGVKHNKASSASFTFHNDKYPHLYHSPDAMEIIDGTERGFLECKNTTSYATAKYAHGVSTSFIFQVCQGLLVSELDFCRILIHIDGWDYKVVTLENDNELVKDIQKVIIRDSENSWKRLEKAREVKKEYGIQNYYQYSGEGMSERELEGVSILQSLEPDLIGTKSEYDFVKELALPVTEEIKAEATQLQIHNAKRYLMLLEKKAQLARLENEVKSSLIKELVGGVNSACINVGSDEEAKLYTFKADKRGVKSIRVTKKTIEQLNQ